MALSKLGVEPGFTGVLYTWTRQLVFHPHVHYLVPGGGLTPDGLRWKPVAAPDFFLPQAVLAARFRNRLRQWLEAEHPDPGARRRGGRRSNLQGSDAGQEKAR